MAAAPLTNLAHLDFLGDDGHAAGAAGPHDLPAGPSRSACSGPTPTAATTGTTTGSAAVPTTRRPTPGRRARSTPTTSPAPPSSTCGTGSRPATRPAGRKAYDLLRAVAYLQTATRTERRQRRAVDAAGRHAEPERRSRRSCRTRPTAPSRTGWPARCGRSARATRPSVTPTPRSPAFLKERLDLSIAALQRQTLARYGQYQIIDGERTPAWLIVDGARRDRGGRARPVGVRRRRWPAGRADGAPAAGRGRRRARRRRRPELAVRRGPPVGAVALDLARLGLADAGRARPRVGHASATRQLVDVAVRDSAVFDPWMLTSGGPDNGRLPTRIDGSQIAYGVDSRLQSLLATAEATGRPGPAQARRRRRRPGTSAPTPRASRCTTRRPGAPSTASRRTAT